jgi:hypothetical protein
VNREERHRILGPAALAEIERHVASLPDPPQDVIDDLRRIFAPIVARNAQRRAAEHATAA